MPQLGEYPSTTARWEQVNTPHHYFSDTTKLMFGGEEGGHTTLVYGKYDLNRELLLNSQF